MNGLRRLRITGTNAVRRSVKLLNHTADVCSAGRFRLVVVSASSRLGGGILTLERRLRLEMSIGSTVAGICAVGRLVLQRASQMVNMDFFAAKLSRLLGDILTDAGRCEMICPAVEA